MKTKSCLQYYGSDASVAHLIADLIPSTVKHLTIPFCGGLGILPHVKARAILANDKNNDAVNFYRVLKSPQYRPELVRRCKDTLCHPEDLRKANQEFEGPVLRAWAYWSRCWLGRKGQGGTESVGQSASIRRSASGGTNASRIVSASSDLDEWANLFHKVEFECRDFRDVLGDGKDQSDCGYYCDPPWVKEGGKYVHPFGEQDHRDLAKLLWAFDQSPVIIRYGDDPLVRELYDFEGHWKIIEASSRTQSNDVRGEIWIVNQCL